MYKFIVRPILFLFQPETIHNIVITLLKIGSCIPGKTFILRKICHIKEEKTKFKLFGIEFPNRVGLAAGFDKDADAFEVLGSMGFGFVEIGTVTPKAQSGNEKPRLFRMKKDKGLINRMGFNNKGVDNMVKKLKKRSKKVIIGGNIGKNKLTTNSEAVNDYEICFNKLYPYVDYFTVNVSSPNTPNLRELQDKKPLTKLLLHLQKLNTRDK